MTSRRPWTLQFLSLSFCWLVCVTLATASVDPNANDKSWMLTSGAEIYRLVARNGIVSVGYFGPMAAAPKTVNTPQEPTRPLLLGEADGEPLSGDSMQLVDARMSSPVAGVQTLTLTLRHRVLSLEVAVQFTAWAGTGVFSRVLRLRNTGAEPIEVSSAFALSMDLPKGEYTLRNLYGGWSEEHQLTMETLNAGGRTFSAHSGRSTNGFAPWISLRNEDSKTEYLAELAWSGNWDAQVWRQPGQEPSVLRDQPVTVRMSMHWDSGGSLNLAPGATFVLPTVAFTASGGDLDDATNQMHRYQRQFVFPASTSAYAALVQFNSWYPYPGNAKEADMERSAAAAAALGVEVFVLDGGWMKQLGDYNPNRDDFPRGLEELSNYVRARNMKFGLWIEIENVALESKMFHDQADWCLSYNGAPVKQADRCELNFAKPEVRAWATATIDRLVNQYKLSWIKIDYNIDVGDRFDPHGKDHAGDILAQHIQHYYAWLDTVRSAHPDLILENSSGGGMRMDSGVLAHTDTSWLSDNVDSIASLQLGFGCTIQFSPEACNHWMVGDNDRGIVDRSKPPGWWDFMFRVPMNGPFGISSRIVDWSPPLKERAAANIAMYKQVRTIIAGADVYHLTAQPAHRNPTGWMAIQYVSPGSLDSVLMAYRLGSSPAVQTFHLRGLDEHAMYNVSKDGEPAEHISGSTLAIEGLQVKLEDEWRAAVYEIRTTR